MTDAKFIVASKNYFKLLRRFLLKNYGRRCGHIGKDKISLDCPICKSWLFYDLFAWFLENQEDNPAWSKNKRQE